MAVPSTVLADTSCGSNDVVTTESDVSAIGTPATVCDDSSEGVASLVVDGPVLKVVRGLSGVVDGTLVWANELTGPSVRSGVDVRCTRVVSVAAGGTGGTVPAAAVVVVVVIVLVVVAGTAVVATLVVVVANAAVVVVGATVAVVVVVAEEEEVVVAIVVVAVVVVVVGHEPVAQLFVCTAPLLNEHAAPPLLAARVTAYVRECWPPPQLAEQSENEPQPPTQSSGPHQSPPSLAHSTCV